jgi:predicted secreted protein
MAQIAGKGTVVKVSVDDVTYYTISSMNDASMSAEGDNQDISTFGTNFIKRLQGLKDVTYSLGGFFDKLDTTGQLVIRSAMINDTALYFQVLMNGTTGFKQSVRASSFEVSSSVDGVSELSIELEGTGTITAV